FSVSPRLCVSNAALFQVSASASSASSHPAAVARASRVSPPPDLRMVLRPLSMRASPCNARILTAYAPVGAAAASVRSRGSNESRDPRSVDGRVGEEAQHGAGLQPEMTVADILRAVELVARERDLGVAELEFHDHVVRYGVVVGNTHVLGLENDPVDLHEIRIAHRLGQWKRGSVHL